MSPGRQHTHLGHSINTTKWAVAESMIQRAQARDGRRCFMQMHYCPDDDAELSRPSRADVSYDCRGLQISRSLATTWDVDLSAFKRIRRAPSHPYLNILGGKDDSFLEECYFDDLN